ncbi:hypothetical protein M0802_004949 [Mischocyttarus mexicanus]|nr:hypothetical protein M0802_004949 [Mischocyttarus mexicanus]
MELASGQHPLCPGVVLLVGVVVWLVGSLNHHHYHHHQYNFILPSFALSLFTFLFFVPEGSKGQVGERRRENRHEREKLE